MTDDANVKKLFVYNEEAMIRLMDQYWDFFEEATLIPDSEPYWVVTMKRPKRATVEANAAPARRPDLIPVRPDGELDLTPVFMKRQEQRKKESGA